jgi:hypothetical protein
MHFILNNKAVGVFFSWRMFAFFDLKSMILTDIKDFSEKQIAKITGEKKKARFLLQVPAGDQNITLKKYFKFFYFHIWSIAKCG